MIEETPTRVVYEYYPEHDKEGGIIAYDKANDKIEVIKLAPRDEFRWYAGHLFSYIFKFKKNNEFKKEGMIAWY